MILIIAASNGKNLELAHAFAREAGDLGQTCKVLDATALDLPLYTPQCEAAGKPAGLDSIIQLFLNASSFVVCAPEYNGSTPPSFTSLVAWLSSGSDDFRLVFNGKPAAIATHSGGHGQKMLVALRMQLGHMGVNVLGRELQSSSKKPHTVETIRNLLGQLVSVQSPR